MGGKLVPKFGETATVPEVGDVLAMEDGRSWVVASVDHSNEAIVLTLEPRAVP